MVTEIWVFGHKIGYSSVCIGDKCHADSCTHQGVTGVGQCHGIIHAGLQPTPVAMITKTFAYCHNSVSSVVQGRATIILGIATHCSFCCYLQDAHDADEKRSESVGPSCSIFSSFRRIARLLVHIYVFQKPVSRRRGKPSQQQQLIYHASHKLHTTAASTASSGKRNQLYQQLSGIAQPLYTSTYRFVSLRQRYGTPYLLTFCNLKLLILLDVT